MQNLEFGDATNRLKPYFEQEIKARLRRESGGAAPVQEGPEFVEESEKLDSLLDELYRLNEATQLIIDSM